VLRSKTLKVYPNCFNFGVLFLKIEKNVVVEGFVPLYLSKLKDVYATKSLKVLKQTKNNQEVYFSRKVN